AGATQAHVDAKTPKREIAERLIRSIRPWSNIETSQTEWQVANDCLKDAHVVFGCVDGYRQRLILERAARRFCIPYIDIGMDVTKLLDGTYAIAGQMIRTTPGAPCMSCLGF